MESVFYIKFNFNYTGNHYFTLLKFCFSCREIFQMRTNVIFN
jgi:hypothetical protein